MNKKRWFPIALAMLTLGACSDDNLSDYENGQPQWNAEGQGYVTLALNLPTTPSVSRADGANDVFDDGEASEYAVNNAKLLIFTGASEDGATFHSAYTLDLNNWNSVTDDPNQITVATEITQLINNFDYESTDAFALVVLNDNGLITIADGGATTVAGNALTAGTTTWTDVQKYTTSNTMIGSGITMLNAALTATQGGDELTSAPSGTHTILAKIDESAIYPTAGEAAGNPAATIYVERAVAKVSVGATNDGGSLNEGQPNELEYAIDGWVLDITNTTSYFGHNVQDSWLGLKSGGSSDYRFAGKAAVESGMTTPLYRLYWAEDPNYDDKDDYGTDAFNTLTAMKGVTFNDLGAYAYCLENTFDVYNMSEEQSTRVIVRAKFTNGTFYTLGQNTDVIYTETTMPDLFKSRLLSNPGFIAWVAENINGTVDGDNIELTFKDMSGKGGKMVVEGIVLDGVTYQDGGNFVDDDWLGIVNAGSDINKYEGGYAYYPVVIKHFGDDLTPWKTGEAWENPAPANGVAYPAGTNRDGNYLGRYGVVRNNWYDINVTSIKRLGYPNVPPAEGSDDNMDAYISVEINILSWAKRTQDVEL